MNKQTGLILLILTLIIPLRAQIAVNDSENIIQVVKRLEGSGVHISNIKYRFSPKAQKRPAGSFTDDFGVLGIDKGLILTSGAAVNALGPNNLPNKNQANNDSIQDPDLIPYIEDYDEVTNRMEDVCYVEFDLISAYPILSFNYIFASEEYIEFLNYHDVFVFLISGPGIVGKRNIALVPGTNIPVSVASINPDNNSQYYIDNGSGSTPWINLDMQYDGYTRVLNASTHVIPCQTYRIKLAIADVKDGYYDAGVFIEEGSFTSSNIDMKVLYEHPRFDAAIEGCNDAYVVFKRPSFSNRSQDLKYTYIIKGNAQNNIDYVHIADSVIIPAGADSAFITISPLADGIEDGQEFVRLVLRSECSVFPVFDSIDIPIRESFPYNIPSRQTCNGQSVILNENPIEGDSIFWDPTPYLNCLDCTSPVALSSPATYFPYTAKHITSGCVARDSVKVEEIHLKADFSYYQDLCYTTHDFVFVNHSKSAMTYHWDFGDNTTSEEEHPTHQFAFFYDKNPRQYPVTLTAIHHNPQCVADTTLMVDILNPVFIPNLITGNQDAKNDNFIISGIISDCWTLTLYNRWGSLVYKDDNYQNDYTGKDLESGVYFFNIQNYPEDRKFNGWIHILND